MADAQITVGANADAATRAAAVVKTAWREAGQSITSSIGSAARQVVGDLLNVATATGKISFSSQHQQVREFEAATAHLAVSVGRDLESVRSEYEATGKSIGKRPAEVAAWVSEVGKLTYNVTAAGQAIKGMSALAAETGRSVDDYRGLAVELATVGHVAGDTSHAVGVLAAQADALGTTGGVAAFASQVEGLSDTISHFAVRSEADFLKVTAAAAVLGKGLSDAAARRVQQGALGAVASDPLRWERYLGHQITDEHGQVKDPVKVLEEITNKTKRRFGKDARRVLMLNFGAETGAAMYNADFSEAARAAGLAPSAKPQEAQQQLNATDAGKRAVAEAELAASSRDLLGSSHLLGTAADKLQQFAAHNPLTSTFVATALGSGASMFMSGFGASIAKIMGGSGAGGGIAGAIQLAFKGSGLASMIAKGIPVVGAAAFGIEAGMKFAEMAGWDADSQANKERKRQTYDVKADRELLVAKEIRDRVRAARGASALPGSYAPSAEDSQLARAAASGNPADVAKLVAQLRKEGESKEDAEHIAAAVASAMTRAMKDVKIVNGTGGPVEVTTSSSASAAAGSQSH